jgi:long-chain fatty acid transport protein
MKDTFRIIKISFYLNFILSAFFIGNVNATSPIHGAKAAGMGGAFVSIADDPSAILHNPAGLTCLNGTQIYTGVTAVMGYTEFKNTHNQTEDSDYQVFFPPHLYVSHVLENNKTAFGLGLFSPFGMGGREWSEKGLTRYVATENLISTFAINPVMAYRPLPQLSIGAGIYYLYASNEFTRMIDQSALGAEDAKFSFEGEGGGIGYNLAILLYPEKKFSFGIAYRSETTVDQDVDVSLKNLSPVLQAITGDSNLNIDAETSLDFPQSISFGLAYRPINSLTIGIELEWTEWSSFERMDLDLDDEYPQAGIYDISIDFDYNDTWFYKFGVNYELNDNYSIRFGYSYIENPVPSHTLNPGNPDADQHSFSIGFGYQNIKWRADVFYLYEIFDSRKIENEILSGEYRTYASFIGLSFGYNF